MKITINYGEDFFNNTIADSQVESLKKLKNIGFEGLDYAVGRGGGVINPIYLMPREKWVNHFKEQRKMIEGEGLEVCQTHATYRSDFDADYPFEYTQKVIDHYKKEIEATNILGCKHMVLHPITKCIMPFREEVDVVSSYFLDNWYHQTNCMEASTTYTLPYWMGSYHGIIK